jgi:endonuclease/exonuclease/phosphatase family metal-dependent hydrolase
MLRKLAVLAALSFALAGWAPAARPGTDAPVTIMTQNMDDGTDQTYTIAALLGAIPGLDVSIAVDLTYYELQFSAFELRAAAMAAEIGAKSPEIVAVQEAALWRTGPTPGAATDVLFDQIDLLVSALRSAGVPYEVVAVNHLSDLALPGNVVGALRFTDRNALLVRSDLRPPAFHLSNVHARTFDAAFTFFPGVTVPAGWISADVHTGNRQFRLVTTHLETSIAGIPEATDVQVAQARELIHALRNLTIPVVICGDFNSDALHGGFVDDTPTVGLFEAAGYTEVWPATHGAGDPGLTWPYYLEDQFPGGGLPPPFFAPSQPFERIDLFFSKGLEIVGSELAVAPMPALSDIPPFASDHAGVIAVFQP